MNSKETKKLKFKCGDNVRIIADGYNNCLGVISLYYRVVDGKNQYTVASVGNGIKWFWENELKKDGEQ